ncbi:hypothetical protein L249_3335 [Ophiocordyceps polyrhachis-furcata BCC 54312]|uniref:Uncharacterized protein n=1 Tax=Ophiocordyceps polyrhachis-furcata BCC 54312 TaxID=1330021 RepID=A0A367LQY0_9HYPO|nr:hypothetical protein L249_3335 [Ophiocordyceps polyrhachis-furcata BCC 54312]
MLIILPIPTCSTLTYLYTCTCRSDRSDRSDPITPAMTAMTRPLWPLAVLRGVGYKMV